VDKIKQDDWVRSLAAVFIHCTDIYEWMRGMGDDWMESLTTECIESMHRYKRVGDRKVR
jgi:hypothetical protein